MPIYIYRCDKCHNRLEAAQRITDRPLTECAYPGCDGELRRVPATTARPILKGGGWEKDGYS